MALEADLEDMVGRYDGGSPVHADGRFVLLKVAVLDVVVARLVLPWKDLKGAKRFAT